jgi:gamma-glutamylcyclotransferase (GGCT)/AIG2-like uncharacterized protein YtfP
LTLRAALGCDVRVQLLFSYGTLRLPSVQKATFGRLLEGERDAVVGFRLGEVRVEDPHVIAASGSAVHPVLLPADDPTAVVEGTVYDLDEDALAAADDYEVDAYARALFPLRSGRTAWVYVLAVPDPTAEVAG